MLSNDQIKEKAKPWLEFLDQLQNIGISDKRIPVPQIAVFGDQSSGKSSLLESISGIPFPKGTGLVTRCPTKISMIHTEPGTLWKAQINLPDVFHTVNNDYLFQPVTTPEALTVILQEAGKIIAGSSSNGFSRHIIQVTVRSPNTPDLSLMDLPGIIRTTTAGQDRSVISAVDSMLGEFMEQAETIILAVIPANQDIATIDVLERAHHYDPAGERTIGVLTKPDLVDKGAEEEILAIVKNIRKPLKLGYIMVKNRSQAELKATQSLSDALKSETDYFSSHPVWSQVARENTGTEALSRQLTTLIVQRALERGPIIKYHLLEAKKSFDQQITQLGTVDIPSDDTEKRKMLVRLISRYTQTLRQVCRGEYRDPLAQHHSEFRIKYNVANKLVILNQGINRCIPDLNSLSYEEKLAGVMSEMKGRELPGFGSTRLLLATVAEELDSWRLQVEDTVYQLFELYSTIAMNLADKLTMQFPKLNLVIQQTLQGVTELQLEAMNKRVEEMFQRSTEGAATDEELIQTINNIRYEHFDLSLREVLTVLNPDSNTCNNGLRPGSKEHFRAAFIEMMGPAYLQYHALGKGISLRVDEARAVLTAYWKICEKKIAEDVHQAVDVVLLQQCSEKVENELLSISQTWLSDKEALQDVVAEDKKIIEQRNHMRQMKVKTEAALQVLDKLLPYCIAKDPNQN